VKSYCLKHVKIKRGSKYLIHFGIVIRKENNIGEVPLFNICRSGNLKLVKYLVEPGLDIHKGNNYNSTTLLSACYCGLCSTKYYTI